MPDRHHGARRDRRQTVEHFAVPALLATDHEEEREIRLLRVRHPGGMRDHLLGQAFRVGEVPEQQRLAAPDRRDEPHVARLPEILHGADEVLAARLRAGTVTELELVAEAPQVGVDRELARSAAERDDLVDQRPALGVGFRCGDAVDA